MLPILWLGTSSLWQPGRVFCCQGIVVVDLQVVVVQLHMVGVEVVVVVIDVEEEVVVDVDVV